MLKNEKITDKSKNMITIICDMKTKININDKEITEDYILCLVYSLIDKETEIDLFVAATPPPPPPPPKFPKPPPPPPATTKASI